MENKCRYKALASLALIGVLFSGYLTYVTYTTTQSGCDIFYFGLPSCFYGMLMYLAVFFLGVTGGKLMKDKRRLALSTISGIGVLFALYITTYVLSNVSCKTLSILGFPPCVFGLAMYVLLLIISAIGIVRKK